MNPLPNEPTSKWTHFKGRGLGGDMRMGNSRGFEGKSPTKPGAGDQSPTRPKTPPRDKVEELGEEDLVRFPTINGTKDAVKVWEELGEACFIIVKILSKWRVYTKDNKNTYNNPGSQERDWAGAVHMFHYYQNGAYIQKHIQSTYKKARKNVIDRVQYKIEQQKKPAKAAELQATQEQIPTCLVGAHGQDKIEMVDYNFQWLRWSREGWDGIDLIEMVWLGLEVWGIEE
jgi:hypothetical protein